MSIFLFSKGYGQGNFNSNAASGGNWNVNTSWTLTGGTDGDGVPDANDNVTILNGHTISITDARSANTITVNSGGTLTMSTGGSLTITTSMAVNGGGTYVHNQDGGTIPTATWAATSNLNITGVNGTIPGGLGQTFGNLTYNSPSQSVPLLFAPTGIAGNFTITSTNNQQLRNAATYTIGGNFIINGANAYFTITNTVVRTIGVSGS
ncbi:MAG: G8 domain-containing protein, partial [Bacteroidota bacterium]